MSTRKRLPISATVLASLMLAQLATLVSIAEASSPNLSRIYPRGGQRGTEVELRLSGARLEDPEEILFYSPGFELVSLEGKAANQVIAKIKIAPDCQLGEHVFQLRTKSGLSEYDTFWVGALPRIDEKEPNSLFEEPQPVAFETTVVGVVQNEDVDYYIVEAKQGQRITAEIEALRLGVSLFDPYVAILDMDRFELVTADDTPLVYQDAVASTIAPKDGQYVIEVRESSYGGNGNCYYHLHIGTFPQPTVAYPAGGPLGQEVEVRFLGDVGGELKQKFTLPAEPTPRFALFAQDDRGIAPTGNPFRLFPHGNAFEQEPNNNKEQATAVELPLAFNGIIETEGDVDWFRFQAKKGQQFEIECYGRRVRSPLDAVMRLYDAAGKQVAANDDARNEPDSYFRYQFPADGEYFVSVNDHLGRGGADFVYRIEFSPVQPSLELSIPRVARYSQERQVIVVPRGNRFGTIISAARQNFGGPIVLEPASLPPGVTMHAEPMRANLNLMPVVFEAAADAPLSGMLVDFRGRHEDPNTGISGGFKNTADMVRFRNNITMWTRDVERLGFAVVDEVPFTLEVVTPKVPLVRSGALGVKVIAHRKEGFDEPITLQFPFRPPGLGTNPTTVIPKGQNEAIYPLNANGNAEIGDWKVYVLGSANVNGNAWVASSLVDLKIADNYVDMEPQRTAAEQGQTVDFVVKLTSKTPFEGNAIVRILGLPEKVTTQEVQVASGATEAVFPIKIEADARVGRHKTVYCEMVIPQNGETMTHASAHSELRIDPPPPQPTKPAPAPMQEVAKKEEPKKEEPKRLTRLEQLRLQAQQAAAGGTK